MRTGTGWWSVSRRGMARLTSAELDERWRLSCRRRPSANSRIASHFYRPPAGRAGRTSGARAWRNFSADLLRPHRPRFAELLAGDERSLARLDADIDLDARA
jgi:hypothetical protein